MMKKVLLLAFLLPLGVIFASAQSLQIKGKVIDDASSSGLSNVSINVVETKKGLSTDNDGNFSFNVTGRKSVTLIFSFVGYATQTVSTNGSAPITVRMKAQQVTAADEVVVIGYGTAKKKDLTGATASMAAKDLERIPVTSPAEALTGRMAGVQVTTTDGQPGAEIVIRVRGGGSVTQDNSPLYIVDGFPVSSINDIAPTDISSIDVLKDASATAIYGARGANGVVIVTTKSAKGGKTTISYNGYGQMRTLPRELDVLSPYEFALAQYEYARVRSQTDVDNFQKLFGVYGDLDLYKYQKGTDWQKKLFGNPVYSQQHNLSITGGTDKTKMSFSISNNKDEGLMPGSDYQRTYLNFKLNHEISKSLKLDLTSRFTNTNINGAGTAGTSSVRIGDGLTTRPINGIADQIVIDQVSAGSGDDYDQFLRSLVDPVTLTAQDYRNNKTKAFNMNAGLGWSVTKNLTYRSEFGYDLNFSNLRRYYGPLTGESKNVGGNLPLGEMTTTQSQRYRWANTLNYLYKKGKSDFNVLLGQEVLTGKGQTEFSRSKYFAANLTPEKLFANMALGTLDRRSTAEYPNDNLTSFFGRIIYQLNSRYIFQATARADGSSKFAPGKQWGIFPAASAAWRISKESFMEDIKFVSDLKLRLSYGAAGNNRIPDNLWRRTYAISDNRTIGFGDVANPYYVASSSTLVNPDLKWETTITRNAGLDFAVLKNRISGSLDFYNNTTKDLLVESDIPSYLGYSKQMRNIGQTSNKGVELSLNGTIVNKKDFQLSAFFNIGVNRATIDKLDGVNEKPFNSNWAGTDLKGQDDYRLRVGETVGLMYGFVTDGFYTVDDFASYDAVTKKYTLKQGVPNVGSYLGGISLRPGILKLKDLDGDGTITAAGDRTVIGSALPKHTGGFGLNAIYKGFDFSAAFNWVYGSNVYNTGRIAFNMYYRTTYGNMLNTVNYDTRFKYIDADGNQVSELEDLRKLNANATMWSPFSMGNASPVFHSYAVEDGSFLRLNNVSLGYTIPKNLTSKVGMSRVRLYGTVYNAFLWTNYSGYDPEVSATRSSNYTALTPNVDFSAYPKSRTYTVGVNVTF